MRYAGIDNQRPHDGRNHYRRIRMRTAIDDEQPERRLQPNCPRAIRSRSPRAPDDADSVGTWPHRGSAEHVYRPRADERNATRRRSERPSRAYGREANNDPAETTNSARSATPTTSQSSSSRAGHDRGQWLGQYSLTVRVPEGQRAIELARTLIVRSLVRCAPRAHPCGLHVVR